MKGFIASSTVFITLLVFGTADAQIGKRFPSERKVVKDPVTGTVLTFLTSTPTGDSKIYQTHKSIDISRPQEHPASATGNKADADRRG